MVSSTGTSLSFVSLALDGSQSATNPAVHGWKYVGDTVFEVPHPSTGCPVDIRHNLLHRIRSKTLCLLSDYFFELFQTLLTWPTVASLEVIAQKVEASLLTG